MKKLNVSFEEGRRLLYERMASESMKPETEEEKKLSEERIKKMEDYFIEDLIKSGEKDLLERYLKITNKN